MKSVRNVLALMALLALVNVAHAVDKPDKAADTTTLTGKITKVAKIQFTIVDANKKNHTITTDKNTKIMVDGKDAEFADLKVGQEVVVTPAKGHAQSVEATSATADAGTGTKKDDDKPKK